MKKGRDNEALSVLLRINHQSSQETFEELKQANDADLKNRCGPVLKELFEKKYR